MAKIKSKKIVNLFSIFFLFFAFLILINVGGSVKATTNYESELLVTSSIAFHYKPSKTVAQINSIPGAPQDDDSIKNFNSGDINANPIVKWLNALTNLVAGVIGVGAILMIVWGGIQYITARDNAQAVQAAKEKIINVLIGLAAFIFLYAFLQWLIPGGIFA